MNVTLDALTAADWLALRDIYLAGIATGQATFETDAPTWEQWEASHVAEARLAARYDGVLVGWVALSLVSRRSVYAGVAEVSVYVHADWRGRGVGTSLLNALVLASETAGFWTLQAGIFPENASSLALHARCGFRVVGRRERIGQLHNIWRDTLLLERRSGVVGVPG